MAFVTVAYPRPAQGAAFKFDLDYYIQTHMPLVQKLWGPMGLKSWTVTDHQDDAQQPFVVQGILQWESKDAFAAASQGEEKDKIFADVPVFTDLKPEILIGKVVGKWEA